VKVRQGWQTRRCNAAFPSFVNLESVCHDVAWKLDTMNTNDLTVVTASTSLTFDMAVDQLLLLNFIGGTTEFKNRKYQSQSAPVV
jgi:hypothetical protein